MMMTAMQLGLVFATRRRSRVVCITARCVCSCWMQKMLRAADVIDMVDISSGHHRRHYGYRTAAAAVIRTCRATRQYLAQHVWRTANVAGSATLYTKNTAAVILTYRLRNVMSGSTDLDVFRCLVVFFLTAICC